RPDCREHLVSRAKTVEVSLFKERNSTQVGIAEMNSTVGCCCFSPRFAPHKAGARPDHRMSPTHHIQAFSQSANRWMRARKVSKNYVGPIVAIGGQQPRPRLASIGVTERVVVSEDCRSSIQPLLVCCYDVTERLALVNYVVPRQRETPFLRSIP